MRAFSILSRFLPGPGVIAVLVHQLHKGFDDQFIVIAQPAADDDRLRGEDGHGIGNADCQVFHHTADQREHVLIACVSQLKNRLGSVRQAGKFFREGFQRPLDDTGTGTIPFEAAASAAIARLAILLEHTVADLAGGVHRTVKDPSVHDDPAANPRTQRHADHGAGIFGRDPADIRPRPRVAWAEYLLGAGRKYRSMICVALGTGIGSGIIMDGRIFHGAMNTAGEIGHCVFEKDGRPCNCGRRGCLERYCSGTGIIQRALEAFPEKFAGLPHRSESVFQLAYAGDQDVLALIRSVVEDLAVGIANAVSILSPQAVIISGGLCDHDELIVKPLVQLVNQYGYRSWARKKLLKIEKAQMGSDAPMIGAALLYKAWNKKSEQIIGDKQYDFITPPSR